jgi:ATP-binding cassette subfamily B protein
MIRLLALYWTVNEGVAMLQLGTVVVVSAVLAQNGTMTVGTLVVFWMLELEILWPVRQMGRILADLGKANVAAGRISEILSAPREEEDPRAGVGGTLTPDITGAVRFDHVSCAYPDGTRVLEDVTFAVPAGATVGILGPTGSGKTTLMMLLDRLFDYSGGSITIDGVELREIDRRALRRRIGYVLQEPFLFARTIRDNLGLARRNANDAALFAAARAAAIHDVIERFDHGYRTAVGEKGVTLSGGQKQRLAIARALLMEPAILIFDDSLSAVDTHTDAQIRAALAERRAAGDSPTTFVISHRVTTLSQTDFVVVLEKGRVAEIGAPEDLIRRRGAYHRVWALQNGGDV